MSDLVLWILLGIVGGALVIAEIFAVVVKIMLIVKYQKANKVKVEQGRTARESARLFLDANGLQNVQVKKCEFWRAAMFGNSYSTRTKTVYLRRGIIDKSTTTACALALQKSALAIQDKEGDKGTRLKTWLQPLLPFASFLFLPIILVGLVFDLVIGNVGFTGTIIATVIAVAFYIFVMFATFLIIKVEKRANSRALQLMEESNFLTETERAEVKKLFDLYVLGYIADFILAVLKSIQVVLKAIAKIMMQNKK